jgi:hypothetical protein
MKELLRFAWDVLLFKHEAYAQHAARTDALKRGLVLLVAVTLVAGVVWFFDGVVRGLRPIEVQRQEVEQSLQELSMSLRGMQRYSARVRGADGRLHAGWDGDRLSHRGA